MQMDNPGVTQANEPVEVSLKVTGWEEIQDGHRTSVDNLNMESNARQQICALCC
jgi:hypothetical protein